MRKSSIIVAGVLVFSIMLLPLMISLPALAAPIHHGPYPLNPHLVPPIDPSNHHHIGKLHVIPGIPTKASSPP
jgi:hypothetical protein